MVRQQEANSTGMNHNNVQELYFKPNKNSSKQTYLSSMSAKWATTFKEIKVRL